jgi:hypothetical protein
MAGMTAESKRETFNKVIQWLKDEGFPKLEIEPDGKSISYGR